MNKYDFLTNKLFMIDHQEWIPAKKRKQYPYKNVFYNKELELSMKIYRYIDTAYLYELLRDNKLFVNNRQNLKDIFEHEEFANHGKANAMMQIHTTNPITILMPKDLHKLSQAEKEDYHVCISSWADESKLNKDTDENILYWGYYSKDLPQNHYLCRIETTLEDFIKSVQDNQPPIWIGRANYHTRSSKWFLNNRIFGRPQEYEIENEIRMCIQHVTDDNYYLKVDPSILVKGIRISPYMPHEDAMLLCQTLCTKYSFLSSKVNISTIQLIY